MYSYHHNLLPSSFRDLFLSSNQVNYTTAQMYGQIHQGTTQKLQAVQNFACRITSGTCKYDHITPFLKELRWLPVASKLFYRNAIMAFKCMSGCAPEYLSSQFIKRTAVSNRKTRNSQKLYIPFFKTASGQRTFYYRTVSLWNSFDSSLKLCRNVKIFKRSLISKLLQEKYGISFPLCK